MSEGVPEGWNLMKLGELSLDGFNNGVFRDPKKVGSGYRLINVFDMYQGFGINSQKLELLELNKKVFINNQIIHGDIFFTRSSLKLDGIAYCNLNLTNENNLTYDGHLIRLRPDQSLVYPIYLAKFCLSDQARTFFMRSAKHSSMTTIGQEDIYPLPVLIPPLPEQQKIASILTSVDEMIEKTQSQVNKLQDLKKATMNELLTRGIGHTEFEDSLLGKIPKSWEVKPLKLVGIEKGIQTGPFGSQLHAHEYTETGIPVVMPKDMKPPYVVATSIARIPENRTVSLDKHRVEGGDILFSRRGDIGRFALMDESNQGWVCGTGCLRVRLNRKRANPYFIAQYLTQDYPIKWLNLNAVGLTMLNLSTGILENLPVLVPPLKEQNEIVSVLGSIDSRIIVCESLYKKHHSLKKSLMQDLLTGKVRVQVN